MKGSANHLVGLYQFSSLSVNYSNFFFGFQIRLMWVVGLQVWLNSLLLQ